jgi:hypothetical protein
MIHKTIAITLGVALVVGALMYGAPAALANPCSTTGDTGGTGGTGGTYF